MTTEMPSAWSDLIEGLTLLATHPSNDVSPLYCVHDILRVMADDSAFTPGELDRLETLGFSRDENEGGFYSFRFGSA